MQEPELPPRHEQLPSVDQLQFRRAQPASGEQAGLVCVLCKQLIADEYFHAQGQVVCRVCSGRIQSGQQSPPSISMLRAVLFGSGAAFAGMALYALVLFMGFEIGIVAIAVGYMVGKAIRHSSHGLGGRSQQILAVLLTYFAITTSYIPIFIYEGVKAAKAKKVAAKTESPASAQPAVRETKPAMSLGRALVFVFALALVAPFLAIVAGGSPIGGLISLFIIFIGLQRAWALTGKSDILVMGPYKLSGA